MYCSWKLNGNCRARKKNSTPACPLEKLFSCLAFPRSLNCMLLLVTVFSRIWFPQTWASEYAESLARQGNLVVKDYHTALFFKPFIWFELRRLLFSGYYSPGGCTPEWDCVDSDGPFDNLRGSYWLWWWLLDRLSKKLVTVNISPIQDYPREKVNCQRPLGTTTWSTARNWYDLHGKS